MYGDDGRVVRGRYAGGRTADDYDYNCDYDKDDKMSRLLVPSTIRQHCIIRENRVTPTLTGGSGWSPVVMTGMLQWHHTDAFDTVMHTGLRLYNRQVLSSS